jgi:hypothetical protein
MCGHGGELLRLLRRGFGGGLVRLRGHDDHDCGAHHHDRGTYHHDRGTYHHDRGTDHHDRSTHDHYEHDQHNVDHDRVAERRVPRRRGERLALAPSG